MHCYALFADSELSDHILIAVNIIASQVIEQTTPLAYDFQQAPSGAVVFLVCLEVFREIRDALAKNGNLDFRRTRVRSVDTMLCDDASFSFFR